MPHLLLTSTSQVTELVIEIGALAKPMKEQVAKYDLPERFVNHAEKINHSITMLYLNGYITESQTDKLRKKLVQSISNKIDQRNKEKVVEG